MEENIKKQNNLLKLGKISQKLLTFSIFYANMILEVYWYSGIVVYFDGQKSRSKNDKLGHPDKKQKQKNRLGNSSTCRQAKITCQRVITSRPSQKWLISVSPTNQLNSGPDQSAVGLSSQKEAVKHNFVFVILTFCFLSKRFFVDFCRGIKGLNKNKNKSNDRELPCQQNYDCWILPATRHLAGNRPQQNHADSLGRGRLNSSSPSRFTGLALLYPRPSRRNYSTGFGNRLLSQGAWFVQKISRRTGNELKRSCITNFKFNAGLSLLSFLIYKTPKYVLARTKNKYFTALDKTLTNFSIVCQGINQCLRLFKILLAYILTNLLTCYDRWILQIKRHSAGNRPQQNHADSLGRAGINSQSSPRQSGLALLYQGSSRRNYSTGFGNQLLSRPRQLGPFRKWSNVFTSNWLNWYFDFNATLTAVVQIQLKLN